MLNHFKSVNRTIRCGAANPLLLVIVPVFLLIIIDRIKLAILRHVSIQWRLFINCHVPMIDVPMRSSILPL